jgi:hypothetical protein
MTPALDRALALEPQQRPGTASELVQFLIIR